MTRNESELPGTAETESAKHGQRRWLLRGVLLVVAGVVIGALALGLFCYSLGVNFSEEGWSESRSVNRPALIASLLGFATATFLFWIGFVLATRSSG